MSQTNSSIKTNKKYTHLNKTERTQIERWYEKDGKSQSEIARLLGRDKSTISREIRK